MITLSSPVVAVPFLAAIGVLGLVIGSFLNVVAYRVPERISLLRESRCPACDQPVRWWQNVPVLSWLLLRGRCAWCRARIPVRYPLVEAGTGLAFAGVTWWWLLVAASGAPASATASGAPASPGDVLGALAAANPFAGGVDARLAVLAAFLCFAAVGIVLALIDVDTQRLPTPIVRGGLLAGITLLTLACLLGGDWWALARAGAGFAALHLVYLVLRLARPDGMGGGDVRLAGLVGLHLGWLGWAPLAVGGFAAFVLGGAFGVALLLGRRSTRRSRIPFGPWIIAGAWVGIVAGDAVWRWYGGFYGVS